MKAYELIDSPDKWTKKWLAVEADGSPIMPDKAEAVRFCAIGAIERAYGATAYFKMTNKLKCHLWKKTGLSQFIGRWNDNADWKTVYETLKELDI